MLTEDIPPRPSSYSRVSLAIITEPGQANPFGTLHGGVILKLADECGGIAALRHAGKGQITTAAIAPHSSASFKITPPWSVPNALA